MNLNKAYIIGRLTQDPEVRSTPSGQSVATLRMATNRVWYNKETSQKQEATEYHTVVAWGRLAEIAGQYLKRGSLAMIEGRLQTRSWVGQDNNKRYTTEIVAESLQLGPRPTGASADFADAPIAPRSPSPRPSVGSTGSPQAEPEIPIIDENELTQQGVTEGVEETEMPLKDDLPF